MKDALLLMVGAFISAWTGIVTSRWIFYRDCVRCAAQAIVDIPIKMGRCASYWDANIVLIEVCQREYLSLHYEGHEVAANKLEKAKNAFGDSSRKALASAAEKQGLEVEECSGEQWLDLVREAKDELKEAGDPIFGVIDGLRPSYSVLFLGAWLSKRIHSIQVAYEVITEHLETGSSMQEIRERRNSRG